MFSGIPKKVIFFSFLFINFLQPSKSAELKKINENNNSQNLNLILTKKISEKGYLLNVKGVINTNTLIDDISSNFSLSDSKKLENLIDFNKKEVLNTPDNVQNWLFFTEKMTIDGDKWKSKLSLIHISEPTRPY